MSGAGQYSRIESEASAVEMAGVRRLDAARPRTRLIVPDSEQRDTAQRQRARPPRRRASKDLAGSILFVMVWTLMVFSVARYAGLDHLLVKAAVPLGILTCIPVVALFLLACYEWFVIGDDEAEFNPRNQ